MGVQAVNRLGGGIKQQLKFLFAIFKFLLGQNSIINDAGDRTHILSIHRHGSPKLYPECVSRIVGKNHSLSATWKFAKPGFARKVTFTQVTSPVVRREVSADRPIAPGPCF